MSFHTHLCGQSLVSAFAQQVLDDAVVVLLRRHVERREAVETLHVHDCGTLHQDTRHLLLPSCRTKPQKENILVCCCGDGRYKKPPLIPQISLAIIMHPLVPSPCPYRRENWGWWLLRSGNNIKTLRLPCLEWVTLKKESALSLTLCIEKGRAKYMILGWC